MTTPIVSHQSANNKAAWWARYRCVLISLAVLLSLAAILIPVGLFVIAPQIAQSMVNASVMEFQEAIISNPQRSSFDLNTTGRVLNAGFMPADIILTSPLRIYWEKKLIAETTMPPIKARGGSARFQAQSTVKVLDPRVFGEFSKTMLRSEEYQWTFRGSITVKALGQEFKDLLFDKAMTLKGFNGFKDSVRIVSLELPSNGTVASVSIDSEIKNPSITGMKLGRAGFTMMFNGQSFGDIETNSLAILPKANNIIHMQGQFLPEARQLLQLRNQTGNVQVVGRFVGDSIGNGVPWLSDGFKGFAMTVPFPGAQPSNSTNTTSKHLAINNHPNINEHPKQADS